MRRTVNLSPIVLSALFALSACSGAAVTGFANTGDGGAGDGPRFVLPGTGSGSGSGASPVLMQGDSGGTTGSGAGTQTVTTIYANTDDALYSLDPMNNVVSLIGSFSGLGGGKNDTSATDCAVNAEGDVYVNSESVIYKATLPKNPGTVVLARVASIALQNNQFYALAFAPTGFLGMGETLVGGDGNGELWSIDTATGATSDLGNFGAEPGRSSYVLALSGDIVFYTDGAGAKAGIATIRSCKQESGGRVGSCTTGDDYLAGIDMNALATAYTSHVRAPSLLAGIYGGSSGSTGPGTGFAELFGLGVWQGTVFGFGRSTSAPPLVSISTQTGAASLISSSSGVMSGWSGAGVSTTTTVTIMAPPPIK